YYSIFFFTDPTTTYVYTLSLHDALPISLTSLVSTTDLTILIYFLVLNSFYAVLLILSIPEIWEQTRLAEDEDFQRLMQSDALPRSEEHTSELQSPYDLVCRLLLEKKKK